MSYGPQEGGGEGPGGRDQPLALKPEEELKVGRKAYKEVMEDVHDRLLPTNTPEERRVSQVLGRLVKASEIPDLQKEINLRLQGYSFEWEAHVVREKQINAFCLPAGKIFVYTGIFDVTGSDDDLLATVMSHEIAHALAHHASERLAREQASGNPFTKLSYSRFQESEADHIGVFRMPFAGYEPRKSVEFWELMHKASQNRQRPPEILSDHPSDMTRIRALSKWAEDARAGKIAYDKQRTGPAGQ